MGNSSVVAVSLAAAPLWLGGAALAAPAPAEAPERAALTAEANRAIDAGRADQAEQALRRRLALDLAAHGPEDPRTAESLAALARTLGQQRRTADAETLLRQAVEINLRGLGRDHPATAEAAERLGLILEDQGRPRDAEAWLRKALDIRRRTLGEAHTQTGESYASLAQNLDTQGREAEAEPLFRKALEIAQARLGERHPAVGMALNNLAACLADQGRHAEAEPLLRRSLAIARATGGEDGLAAAAVYGNLALSLAASGRAGEAEPLFRKALEIDRARLGERHPALAVDNARLAQGLVALGRYAEAEPHFRQALDIDIAVFGARHHRVAAGYHSLAANLDLQARYAEAEPLYRKALEIRREVFGEANHHTASAYGSVAANLHAQGRYAEAEPLYRKALAIEREAIGESRAETAEAYLNLAVNLDAQARHAEAEPLLRRALDIRRRTLGDKRAPTGQAYGALAANLAAQGRRREAGKLYRRALAIVRAELGERHPDTAQAYEDLAAVLGAEGKLKSAEPLLRKALAIRRAALGEHPLTAASYDALAQNLYLQGAPVEAEALSAEAVRMVRARRQAALAGSGADASGAIRRARVGDQRDVIDPRILTRRLHVVWAAAEASPRDFERLRDEAFRTAQELEVSAAGQALAQRSARADAEGPARLEQELSAEARRLEARLVRTLAGGQAEEAERLRRSLEGVGSALAAVQTRLSQDDPDYIEQAWPAPIGLAEAQARLGADEGLLLIVPIGEDIQVFGVSRGRAAWRRIAGGQARVDRLVRVLRCQVDETACPAAAPGAAKGPAAPFDLAAAHALYLEVVAPVEDAFAGVGRLFVTTSGALATLPLSLLVTAPPAADPTPQVLARTAWLADRFALTTLPSVANLNAATAEAKPPARRTAFLGYGDPILAGPLAASGRRGAGTVTDIRGLREALTPLPKAGQELRAMAKALGAPPSSLRTGARATEAALKAAPELGEAEVLAFATHGLQSHAVAGVSEPSLVFTPPARPTAADDGLLTASEAARLKLSADWVILSACNTAGGDGRPGAETLSGLARAFLFAGAKSLLASHWQVFDESTAALTVQALTLRRHAGVSKAEALQGAMRAVRSGRLADGSPLPGWTPQWAHPAHWAPFVLIGSGE